MKFTLITGEKSISIVKSQRSRNILLAKYGDMSLCDEYLKNQLVFDHEDIQYEKIRLGFIGNPWKYGSSLLEVSIFPFMNFLSGFNLLISIRILYWSLFQAVGWYQLNNGCVTEVIHLCVVENCKKIDSGYITTCYNIHRKRGKILLIIPKSQRWITTNSYW